MDMSKFLGLEVTKEMITYMIGSADINSDGIVSEEELTEMLMKILKT